MIEVSEVVKTLGGTRALDGATLAVAAGEVYGLAGRNGAGKSTLVRHVMGAYRPDAGAVLVGGLDPYSDARARGLLACVHDEAFHWAGSTLRDMALLCRKVYPAFDFARFEELGGAFPGISARDPLRRMSRGMRKQASLWLALSCRPAALVLDEPLDGLDPIARRTAWALVRAEAEGRGMAALVCTHSLRELEGSCGRVGFMDAGRVVAEVGAGGMSGDDLEAAFVQELGVDLPFAGLDDSPSAVLGGAGDAGGVEGPPRSGRPDEGSESEGGAS